MTKTSGRKAGSSGALKGPTNLSTDSGERRPAKLISVQLVAKSGPGWLCQIKNSPSGPCLVVSINLDSVLLWQVAFIDSGTETLTTVSPVEPSYAKS